MSDRLELHAGTSLTCVVQWNYLSKESSLSRKGSPRLQLLALSCTFFKEPLSRRSTVSISFPLLRFLNLSELIPLARFQSSSRILTPVSRLHLPRWIQYRPSRLPPHKTLSSPLSHSSTSSETHPTRNDFLLLLFSSSRRNFQTSRFENSFSRNLDRSTQ